MTQTLHVHSILQSIGRLGKMQNRYYVVTKDSVIINKGYVPAPKGFIFDDEKTEVTKELFASLRLPATFDLSKDGQFINIVNAPELELLQPPEPETEILRDYVLDIDYRLVLHELGI